uniref:BTSP n=1 Tax=Argas monolakensis TaxID=34602 RepID=Q09JU4_ARGMO|nr:BTSP [Argas monolakensis]
MTTAIKPTYVLAIIVFLNIAYSVSHAWPDCAVPSKYTDYRHYENCTESCRWNNGTVVLRNIQNGATCFISSGETGQHHNTGTCKNGLCFGKKDTKQPLAC